MLRKLEKKTKKSENIRIFTSSTQTKFKQYFAAPLHKFSLKKQKSCSHIGSYNFLHSQVVYDNWQQKRLQYWEGLQLFRISTVIQYHPLAWYKEHMCRASKGLVNCHVDSVQYASLHFFPQIMYCFHQAHCMLTKRKLWNNLAISTAEGSIKQECKYPAPS